MPFRLIWRYREIVKASVISELKSAYAGSVLGMAWIAIGPFILLCLYSMVYGVIFRVKPPTMSLGEYIAYVLAGLTAFMGFSSGITMGAQSLARSKQLLLSTAYPSELLGVRTVLVQSAQVVAGICITIVLAILLAHPTPWLLTVPFIIALQIMFTCGVVWVLSLASLALRDIQHILQYVMFVFLIITPIGYDRELVPPALQFLMYFNPLYYFVTLYQDAIVFGKPPGAITAIVAIVGSVATFVIAFRIFRRTKQVFFDYA
jgi:lipopolysaccharide transport system permease protein